ncbi:alpha/beta hydrolase, partial [Candidatus Omnitrophota bacterium]
MLIRIPLYILVFLLFAFFYFRHFERRGIYYPTKEITFTPAEAGMQYEDIFFKTQDSLQLNGWFIPADKPRATLLFCHGNAGNIGHRVEIARIFNQLNLNVFIFDYRGYGRSQGVPSEQGLHEDARSAFYYLLSRDDIDRQAIIIYGKSIGANVAVQLASKTKAAALIAESGFTSAYDMARKLFPYLPVKWMITVQFNALAAIKDIATPKFVIHSRDDEIVPFWMGRKLFESAPEPKEFYEMRGTHNQAIFTAGQEYSL